VSVPRLSLLLALCAACTGAAPAGRRVISLHDVTTEAVLALGAPLAGAAEPIELPPVTRAVLAAVPRAEGAESILALRPTVVLGMEVIARRSPELVDLLRRRGIDVWLGHPTTVEETLEVVTAVAARVGAAGAGTALRERLRARLGPAPAGDPLPVFVYDCCDPPFTAGRTAVLTDALRLAGGRNLFADVDADWTHVSWEEVIARRPQLIVVDDYAMDGQEGVEGKRRKLASLRALAGVPVTVLPLGLALGGVRTVDGVERLDAAIRAVRRP
jgi:iron complex transport system substrate-binding protein